MRNGYSEFTKRGAEVIAVGPDDRPAFQRYWSKEKIPFIGLADSDHRVARMYRQEVNIFKLGRMPLVCIVDTDGRIRYVHYALSMSDIPDNQTLLQVIDELSASSNG